MAYLYTTLLAVYVLWLFYLAVMNLYRAKKDKKISTIALVFGYPILIVGVILDMIINLLLMTIILLEFPKELLVTQRLTRHIKEGGWRGKVSYWICHYFLNAFDPSGDHCD